MRIRIRNLIGIENADVALDPGVLLVAGQNGAGKSSLIQAIASAAVGSWHIRGVSKKADLPMVVRAGATGGSILLEYTGGSCRISYPDGAVEQHGRPPDLGTPLGFGFQRFMSLPAATRLAEMQTRFQTAPTREDFDRWWREHPTPGIDPSAKPGEKARDAAEKLWADIEESGWDAVAKRESGKVTMIQGRWAEATGARWGVQLRQTWAPPGLHRGETYSLDEAIVAVAEAKALLEQKLSLAASGTTKRDALRAAVGGLPEHRGRLAAAEERKAKLDKEIEKIILAKEADGEPVDPRKYPACPHCSGALWIKTERGVGLVLEKAPERMDLEAYEAAVIQRNALLATIAERRGDIDQLVRDISLLRAHVAAGETAEQDLAALAEVPEVTDEEIANARVGVDEAEGHRARVQKLLRAIDLNEQWEVAVLIRDAIASDGIRGQVLALRTSEISVELTEVSRLAEMGELRLDPVDAALIYDGKPYNMLSESEQWRADFLMALVLNKREKAKLFVADRLDLLHPQARPGVLQALAKLGIPCVVCMTARDPKQPPDLAQHGLGRTAWLGGAKIEVAA